MIQVNVQSYIDAPERRTQLPERNSVRFSVKDTGIGMTEDVRQSLFQSFEQAPGTNTKFGGTGLGLYISRLIVEALGGTIGVDSKEGEGSTFYFDLPVSAKL
jgi:two-component system sensor histidine kinase/response regulator